MSFWEGLFGGRESPKGNIHDAAQTGELETAKALLKHNPDLAFRRDKRGYTALHVATLSGHKDIAELLLASKADVSAKGKDGKTPLHLAASSGHKDVLELQLAHNAEVNIKCNEGMTPLLIARRPVATRTWRNYCWPARPRSIPFQGQGRQDAFALGGEFGLQGCSGVAAGQQSRGQR